MKVRYFIGTPDELIKQVNIFLKCKDIIFKSAATFGDRLKLIMFIFYEPEEKIPTSQSSTIGKPTMIGTTEGV